MLTAHVDDVDAALPLGAADAPGLWLSLDELAAERSVSKQAISQSLKRWAAAGTAVSTRRDGRRVLVNVAEYDRAKGELVDLARAQTARTKKGDADEPAAPAPGAPNYTKEQARRAAYEADLKQLDLEERLGRLVPVDQLAHAAAACAEAFVRMIEQLPTRADDVAAAVAKDGVTGARAALKQIARELRERAAEEFAKLPSAALGAGQNEVDADA